MIGVGERERLSEWVSEESSLSEESSINSRGQNMPRGGQSCAERREKPREQGIGKAAAASQDLREGVEDVEWRAL